MATGLWKLLAGGEWGQVMRHWLWNPGVSSASDGPLVGRAGSLATGP